MQTWTMNISDLLILRVSLEGKITDACVSLPFPGRRINTQCWMWLITLLLPDDYQHSPSRDHTWNWKVWMLFHSFLDKICKVILHHPHHQFMPRWKYLRGGAATFCQDFSLWVMTNEKGKTGRGAQACKAKAFLCLYGSCWRLFIPIFIYSELRLQHYLDSWMLSVMIVQGIQTHFPAWLAKRLKQKGQNINCQHEVEATHKKISYCIFSASISFWNIA